MLISKVLNFFVPVHAEINNIYPFLPTCDLSTLLNLLAVGFVCILYLLQLFLKNLNFLLNRICRLQLSSCQ